MICRAAIGKLNTYLVMVNFMAPKHPQLEDMYIYIYIYLCPLQHVVLFTSISNSTIIFPESFNVVADYEHIQDIRAYGIVWSLVWSKGGDNNIGEEKLESLLMMRKRELEMESERAFNFQACQMSICATKLN